HCSCCGPGCAASAAGQTTRRAEERPAGATRLAPTAHAMQIASCDTVRLVRARCRCCVLRACCAERLVIPYGQCLLKPHHSSHAVRNDESSLTCERYHRFIVGECLPDDSANAGC